MTSLKLSLDDWPWSLTSLRQHAEPYSATSGFLQRGVSSYVNDGRPGLSTSLHMEICELATIPPVRTSTSAERASSDEIP